jgi:hypothetical protein
MFRRSPSFKLLSFSSLDFGIGAGAPLADESRLEKQLLVAYTDEAAAADFWQRHSSHASQHGEIVIVGSQHEHKRT